MIAQTDLKTAFARRLTLRQTLCDARHDPTADKAARRIETELSEAEAKICRAEQERTQAFEMQPAAPVWSIQR